jgi:DNA polymerase-3 subunit beta
MNFLIKKNVFIRALAYVDGITSRNTNLPILANIHMGAKDKSVVFSATNLELGVVVSLPAQVVKEGEGVVAPRILASFLGQPSDDVVEVKKIESSLSIKEQKRSATIQLEGAEEFPIIPSVTPKEEAIIPVLKFIPALERVVGSVSISEAKPELTGVFVSLQPKEWVLAATDGFRLSEVCVGQASGISSPIQCIIPLRCAQAIIKVFRGGELEGDIFMGYEDSQFVVRNEDRSVYIVSKVIEGEYPAYTSIIPKEFITTCAISRNEFLQNVKGAGLFATRANTVRVEIEGDKAHITSGEGDMGSFVASMDIEKSGEDCSLVFNHHYLIDGLQNIQGEKFSFKVSKKDGPALLSGVDEKHYLYLIMPIRET